MPKVDLLLLVLAFAFYSYRAAISLYRYKRWQQPIDYWISGFLISKRPWWWKFAMVCVRILLAFAMLLLILWFTERFA